MKGFRNILVCRYGEIDDKLVYKILKNNSGGFDIFIALVTNLLSKNSKI